MELKQLQSYCSVVKYKSFTKAAEKLFLSQPTISMHIRQLEEEFQSQLIIRTTKSIEVTPRGQELYACARNIVNLQEKLLRSWQEEDRKIIHIGASTIPSAYLLPELLPAYRAVQSDVEFHVYQGDTQGIVSGLLCGTYNIGLIGADPKEPTLQITPFFEDRMVVITPNSEKYRSYGTGEISLEDFCRQPILLREKGSGSKKSVTAYLEANGIDEDSLQIAARLNDQESIKNLVAGGLGVSVISEKAAADAVKAGKLLAFSLPGQGLSRKLYIAVRRGGYLNSGTQKFMQFVQSFYKK